MKSITIASQHFTKRAGRVKLPYLDEVAGYYLFGGSEAASTPNLAHGASQNLAKIATPTYGTGYAVIDGTNGFDTGLLLDEPFTQIVVGLQTVANSAIAITGRGTGNADNFVDMMRCSSASPFTADGWPDGTREQSIDGLDSSAGYRLYAQSWVAAGRHVIFSLAGTALAYSTSSVNFAKTTTPTHTLKFGTGSTGGSPPVFRISAAVLAAKVLTTQQIYEIGIYLRALLAARGITML